jgi:2-furoyl-CoA dehydrogenase 2Fe-2S iron sulfur subunit
VKLVGAHETIEVSFTLNGRNVMGRCTPRTHLADFLRHEINATGTHVGCEHGICGACTVLIDGQASRSCLVYAIQMQGRQVTTVEGLANGLELNPLQQAFKEHFALQCGFCTPGILISATDFLAHHPSPTEREVREMLGGHLCRCTGYEAIVRAILAVSTDSTAEGQRN